MKKLCFLLALLSVTFLNGHALSETLFSDTFDSYTTDSPPGDGWGRDESGGDVRIDDTIYYGASGKSVRIQRTDFNGSPYLYLYHEHFPMMGDVTYEAYLRTSTTLRETLTMFGYNPVQDVSGPWLSMGFNPCYLSYYDGAWHDIMAISEDTWYHIKMVVHVGTNTFDVYVDDMITPKMTGGGFWGATNYLGSLAFEVYNYSNPPQPGDRAYIDNVTISGPVPTGIAVPTITQCGMFAMILFLGGGAAYLIRKRRTN